MLSILAHRANIRGSDPATENRLPAVKAALERGWGIETDIRRSDDGRFYVSHDPRTAVDDVLADTFCALFRAHPAATIALNVKELGYEAELLAYLDEQRIATQVFLFDMELLEGPPVGRTARLLRGLHPSVRLAARVSDRNESVEQALATDVASVVWLDEFDGPWATEQDVRRLKSAGRTVWAVSPELHGHSRIQAEKRWTQFCTWGADGICTDYPGGLERSLGGQMRRAET